MKKVFLISALIGTQAQSISALETISYNQAPVITDEFEVKQGNQNKLADLPIDTNEIKVESDFLGIKKFYNETFDSKKIKERYDNSLEKLRSPKSDVVENPKHR